LEEAPQNPVLNIAR